MTFVELAKRRWGNGERRLLLLHGLVSNAALWWRVGPALAELDYLVTAVDLRGHGDSPPGDDYRITSYAGDLLAMDDRPWDVVLGHSLGGAAALIALDSNPAWAGRLILEDPWLIAAPRELALEWLMPEPDQEPTFERVRAENPTWHPEDVRLKVESLRQADPGVIQGTIDDNLDLNLVANVAGLDVPTLLVGADPEMRPLIPPALGDSLADLNPNVRFEVLSKASHSMHRDEFEPFVKLIRGFLS